jgi:hypothetical protein
MRRITRGSLRALFGALLAAMMLAGPSAFAGKLADDISQFDQGAGDQVRSVEDLLTPAEAITSSIPENPQEALIEATSELSADLGFPQDPAAQILLAQLPDEVAGRLANVLSVMRECNGITQTHLAEIGEDLEQVAADGGGLDPAQFADVRACALSLWKATNELELTLAETRSHPSTLGCPASHNPPVVPEIRNDGSTIDVWPVLRFEGMCHFSNTYANDYLLTVDAGGNDVYANNAASNMVDLNFAPITSRVPGVRGFGPARGCQQAIAGLRQTDCVPAVSVVLDVDGTDTYGVMQSPDLDSRCTPGSTQLIRRMVTGGVGFLGVGILRDAGVQGDRYTSKTVSLGAGHIFGVGILSDAGGNDSYLSIRNSQGFALVGGVGILADHTGDDAYDFYMPPPINPAAPNQSPGAGGVLDDEARDPNSVPPDFLGECDRIPRFTQGIGNVTPASLGILVDFAGNDRYRGAFGPFTAPGQLPALDGHIAGSLGFGANGGVGIFADLGFGFDSYTTLNEPFVHGGQPRRRDQLILPPGTAATGRGGVGLFADR